MGRFIGIGLAFLEVPLSYSSNNLSGCFFEFVAYSLFPSIACAGDFFLPGGIILCSTRVVSWWCCAVGCECFGLLWCCFDLVFGVALDVLYLYVFDKWTPATILDPRLNRKLGVNTDISDTSSLADDPSHGREH